MKRKLTTFAAAALVVVSSACVADTETETTPDAAVVEEPPAVTPAPAPASAEAAQIAVDSLAGAGAFLTDGDGRAVYLLEGEPADSSECYGACAAMWPPFLAGSATAAADAAGLRSDLIGTLQRTDGSTQVTYGGHPLYYYHDDVTPGQTTGHDVTDEWGEWYLVTPAGEPLEGTAEPNGG